MFLSTITNRGATPGLIKTMAFTQERLRMISENVANIHTPGYKAKQLDVGGFQQALGRAFAEHKKDYRKRFVVESGDQVRTDELGFLKVKPSDRPTDNILFHDGTDLSIERQMADLAETGMAHEMAATLLRGNFDGLRRAIRGRM
jgi:flagellar basal-body rod protein FlgB